MTTPATLFPECPLSGCRNTVADSRWPCGECEAVLAGHIRPSSRQVTAEQAAGELAEGDRQVARVMAGRRVMVPLHEGSPP